jgi:hypothetical protein
MRNYEGHYVGGDGDGAWIESDSTAADYGIEVC